MESCDMRSSNAPSDSPIKESMNTDPALLVLKTANSSSSFSNPESHGISSNFAESKFLRIDSAKLSSLVNITTFSMMAWASRQKRVATVRLRTANKFLPSTPFQVLIQALSNLASAALVATQEIVDKQRKTGARFPCAPHESLEALFLRYAPLLPARNSLCTPSVCLEGCRCTSQVSRE